MASERVHIKLTNSQTKSAQVLVQQQTKPLPSFQLLTTISIKQCKSLQAADENWSSNDVQTSTEVSKYRKHPQRKQKSLPRFRIVINKSIHFQCSDKFLPLRPDQWSQLQLSNLFHTTQCFFHCKPVTAKQYRDFQRILLFWPDHRFLLQFLHFFHDTQWLFDSHPVTGKIGRAHVWTPVTL